MRALVILRGSPASGKSTWVQNMGLKNYTICADDIRMLFESPVLIPDEKYRQISQLNDNYVWELIFELLKKRMEKGEFIVVDATHSRSSDFSKYNKLCERYRYRKYYVEFSDVPIEECKKRNALREGYKRVPEAVIEKMYARMQTQPQTSGWVKIDRENFWKEIGVKLFNYDNYEKVHIFGDIHGCYEPLKEYFEQNPYSEKDAYIFTGDYIDRGIQNRETLDFLLTFYDRKNVLMLEGNHERWLYDLATDEIEEIKSNEFKKHTVPQIYDMNMADLRSFYRKLGQIAFFEFNGSKYIVSHGGIPYIPEENGGLLTIATEQFIKGVGDYSTNIDEIFSENAILNKVVQVHGHRNTFDTDGTAFSYNLEGHVEFGGELRVLELTKDAVPKITKIKNNIFREPDAEPEPIQNILPDSHSLLEELRADRKNITEKALGNNISSFNFTRDAFYNKNWTSVVCKARGLFMNTQTGTVVARGYEKFFNINERRETELEHLIVKFKDKPITLYKKENGFLGIMSFVNDELFMASKSSNVSDFAGYFKKIYEESDIDKEKVKNYISKHNLSLLFEVIDIENDPHIIEYEKSKIVLLDAVKNDIEFERLPYPQLQELAKEINCECKSIYKEFDNVKDFHRWYLDNTNEDDMSKEDIEGVVIECGDIMTKLKFPYYNFWKKMRGLKEQVRLKHNVKLSSLFNATSNYFYKWLKDQPEEILEKDIITLRKKFFKEVKL